MVPEHHLIEVQAAQLLCLMMLDWVTVAGEEVPWGASLARLPLRHLQLGVSNGSPIDLLHRSRLTALTNLHLNVCSGLDDATVVGVVKPLTRLQGLSLKWDLQDLSIVVKPLPKLMQLSSLRLKCPYGVGLRAGDLRALAPSTRLSSFEVPLGGVCTPAVVQEWLDGMPCLDGISSSCSVVVQSWSGSFVVCAAWCRDSGGLHGAVLTTAVPGCVMFLFGLAYPWHDMGLAVSTRRASLCGWNCPAASGGYVGICSSGSAPSVLNWLFGGARP